MDPEAYLLHQVHPAKLGADVSAALVSNVLLWRGRPGPALLVRYIVPAVASLLVVGLADVAPLRATAGGRYALAHMPPEAAAIRLAGDTLMAIGASRRSVPLMLLGLLTVVAGWSHGLAFAPVAGGRMSWRVNRVWTARRQQGSRFDGRRPRRSTRMAGA